MHDETTDIETNLAVLHNYLPTLDALDEVWYVFNTSNLIQHFEHSLCSKNNRRRY